MPAITNRLPNGSWLIKRDLKKFVVYKSSAGSGKTFTLVREYLSLVLQNPDLYRQILAITFTNKAANEMKDRIVRSLMLLSDPQQNTEEAAIKYLLPALIRQTGLNDKQISMRASLVLSSILHNYTELAISTIDSFTHRVIRTFAHDLKIPLNFEVELDTDNLLSQAVDMLVSQVGSDEKLTRIMVEYIEKKAGDEMSWQIEKDLNDFGKALFDERSIGPISKLRNTDLDDMMAVRRNLEAWKAAWENRLQKLAGEITKQVYQQGLSANDFIQKKNSVVAYLEKIAGGNFKKLKPGAHAEKAFRSQEWIAKNAPGNVHAAFANIQESVFGLAAEFYAVMQQELQRYMLCKLLVRHLFATALLAEIEKTLQGLCMDGNKLLINEFNRRIAGVVSEQPAPFIYERLGEKYHHYLIDEFQDTSVLQWHNLLPLIENSLASNRMNLLVGDAKQAIYRWRSGDAEQFEALPHLIRTESDSLLAGREQTLAHHFIAQSLSYNHRSSGVIVDFNNKLFTHIYRSLPEKYGGAFSQVTQQTGKSDKPGYVKIQQIGHKSGNVNYADAMQDGILSIIHELADDNFPLSEIAILCRDNHKASSIADYLMKKGIPVISSESLLLTQSEKVNFILSWIRYFVNPEDEISRIHILNFLIDKGFLPGVKMEDQVVSGENFSAGEFDGFLASRFEFYSYDRLKRLELFGVIRYLIIHFNLDTNGDSYIRFFQDTVLEFLKQRKGALPEFLDWWEEKSLKASVIIPEGIEAIRIMTIHKAKGLEFPVVIYPYADEQVRPTRKNLWIPLEEPLAEPLKAIYLPVNNALAETIYVELHQDEMDRSFVDMVNLLYVALTRPEERLFILTDEISDKTDGAKSIGKLLGAFLISEGVYKPEKDYYEFGTTWKKNIRQIEPGDKLEHESIFTPRSTLQMRLRYHAPQLWDIDDPEKNREWGKFVHAVMARIMHAGDVDEALQDMLVQGELNPGQYDDLQEMLRKILTHPQISRFFDTSVEIKNEPEIVSADGTIHRPDRLVTGRDGMIIIDYKTGRPAKDHQDQLNTYAQLLQDMNYKVAHAYLLYLNKEPEVVQVI